MAFFQQQFGKNAEGPKAAASTGESSAAKKATDYNYGSMDWVDPDKTEPAGTQYKTFHSKTIDGDVSYLVYLPPDYDASASTRYPVLYELHASGGTPGRGANVVPRFDKAIRAGKIPPMIIVCPQRTPRRNDVLGYEERRVSRSRA